MLDHDRLGHHRRTWQRQRLCGLGLPDGQAHFVTTEPVSRIDVIVHNQGITRYTSQGEEASERPSL
ncbi:MAG: hypothetical protein OXF56_10210 [Rhodobacteraceae bacterium]|nr:hypothetical protein [Paracoccaceae bacterium]